MQQDEILKTWYQTTEGSRFVNNLSEVLRSSLDHSFGYYALQLGYSPINLLENSKVTHCFIDDKFDGSFQSNAVQLPIDSASIDVLVLSHALELSSDPYATLREAERVLVGEGKLFILGFTPFSPTGLYQRAIDPDFQRFTSMRVRDWLGVLGFECGSTKMLRRDTIQRTFKSPVLSYGLQGVNHLLGKAKGRGYLVQAKKRVTRLTPLKQQWNRPRQILKPVGVVKPSAQVARHKWRQK